MHGVVCAVLYCFLGVPGLQVVRLAYSSVTAVTSRVRTGAEYQRRRRIVGGAVWEWCQWCPSGALLLLVGGVAVMSVGSCRYMVTGRVRPRSG